jgi:mannose-1-phosphate guanylyltransferase
MDYALIMAGGSGTRLWPFSRRGHPKQMLSVDGERTLFAHAVERLTPLFQPQQILVVTRAEHVAALSAQAPQLPLGNFVAEPEGRGTAPAIGLGAITLRHRDPDAIMAVLTADHFIADADRFRQIVAAAARVAEEGHLVTLGIRPTYPSTGYGYIKQGQLVRTENGFPVFQVEQFVEKPNPELACALVENREYSWNGGMFIWRVERILAEIQRQMPEFYAQLMEVEAALGAPNSGPVLSRVWSQVAKQTIDYGVMEGAQDVVVIPADIGWSDIGSWTSLVNVLGADEDRNTVVGPHLGMDTCDTLVMNQGAKRLVVTIGVEHMVVVSMDDVVLVCSKEREQDVRHIGQRLEQKGWDDWL